VAFDHLRDALSVTYLTYAHSRSRCVPIHDCISRQFLFDELRDGAMTRLLHNSRHTTCLLADESIFYEVRVVDNVCSEAIAVATSQIYMKSVSMIRLIETKSVAISQGLSLGGFEREIIGEDVHHISKSTEAYILFTRDPVNRATPSKFRMKQVSVPTQPRVSTPLTIDVSLLPCLLTLQSVMLSVHED
ncbi:hypothetical protein Tco_0734375, partial [Tanacetum coccineum]